MMSKDGKILVTAAGGKVGQHVVTQLAEKKISARAGVHSPSKASALEKTGVARISHWGYSKSKVMEKK